MDGILLINKPSGITSRDVVNTVSKKLQTRKVGHTGTLDPLATGVLVICVGKATKLVKYLTDTYKEYEAEVILGIKTDTADITGKVLKEESVIKSKEEIENALKEMQGTYLQTVPIYSAVKVEGKKLYEYARENIQVELPKRNVEIKNIDLLDYRVEDEKTVFRFKTTVSKGTYIRSLVEDIALKLNTVGTMSKLTRTKQGRFTLSECSNIDDELKLISIKDALKDFYIVEVTEELEPKICNGAILDNIYKKDLIVFKKNDTILAVYKKYDKDETKIKPDIVF